MPIRALAVAFPVLLAVAVAQAIQVTGVLLILTLVVTPAAAANRISPNPSHAVLLSIALAAAATLGGIIAGLQWNAPVSFFLATFSFTAYVGARLWDVLRRRPRLIARSRTTAPPSSNRERDRPASEV